MFIFIGCQLDTHNNPYDSPFDVDGNKKLGIFPPALTLYPKDAKVNVQESVDMSVYVIEVNDLTGANAVINYDFTKQFFTLKYQSFFGEMGNWFEISNIVCSL